LISRFGENNEIFFQVKLPSQPGHTCLASMGISPNSTKFDRDRCWKSHADRGLRNRFRVARWTSVKNGQIDLDAHEDTSPSRQARVGNYRRKQWIKPPMYQPAILATRKGIAIESNDAS
jgi:hypothetical protein